MIHKEFPQLAIHKWKKIRKPQFHFFSIIARLCCRTCQSIHLRVSLIKQAADTQGNVLVFQYTNLVPTSNTQRSVLVCWYTRNFPNYLYTRKSISLLIHKDRSPNCRYTMNGIATRTGFVWVDLNFLLCCWNNVL